MTMEQKQLAEALVGFRGGDGQSGDEARDEGAEEGFAPAARVVHELEEAEVVRPYHPSDFLARWAFLCLKGIRRAWGGLRMGGIATVATAIGADLAARLPRQNKKQREGLALLVATALDVRDVNLMEWAAALPRAAARLDMRYQWISRLLGNALIDTDAVMAPFAREVLARAGADGRTLVL